MATDNTARGMAAKALASATTATSAAETATQAAQTANNAADVAVSASNTATTAQADVTEKAQAVAASAVQVAKDRQTVQTVAESIPTDYSGLSEDVSQLKEDLVLLNDSLLDREYSLTIGDKKGYFFGHFIADNRYTCKHITNIANITEISCNVLTNNAGVILIGDKNGNYTRYAFDVGSYSIKIPDNAKDIWLNFWDSSYVNGVTIYNNVFKDYQDGFIFKTLEVPQKNEFSSDRFYNTS